VEEKEENIALGDTNMPFVTFIAFNIFKINMIAILKKSNIVAKVTNKF